MYPHSNCLNGEGEAKVATADRGRNTLEIKQEAARLVELGQSMASAAQNTVKHGGYQRQRSFGPQGRLSENFQPNPSKPVTIHARARTLNPFN
jgi:hypothetical protein